MGANYVALQQLMTLIEIPISVQEKVNVAFDCLEEQEIITSVQKLLDSAVAPVEAKRLAQLYKGQSMKELAIHLYAAIISWENIYQPLQIPYDIYLNTMKAFTRFLKETKRATNQDVFDRGFWTWRYLSGLEFRIEQLEFEMIAANHKSKAAQLDGQAYLSLHIPSDAKLKYEEIQKNYRSARSFFGQYFPDYRSADIVTDTWLLSPKLKDWLPARSNLVLFANDYELLLSEPEKNEGVLWIFNTVSKDLKSYPEETTLQKAAKAWMLAGHGIGSAMGKLR
jgi:hypothetical protein